jgi:electron transport complex protein RnfA
MTALLFLFVSASLSLNLILHFAFGLKNIAEGEEEGKAIPFAQIIILFLSVFILWLFSTYALSFLAFGLLEYLLLFPLSVVICMLFEKIYESLFQDSSEGDSDKKDSSVDTDVDRKYFSPESGYNALILTALFLTLNLAGTILEAFILSLSFALGTLISIFLLRFICRRSLFEAVPANLRGRPLMLISSGLLSLVFTSFTAIFFRVLGVF